jgi:hypothetical protein
MFFCALGIWISLQQPKRNVNPKNSALWLRSEDEIFQREKVAQAVGKSHPG